MSLDEKWKYDKAYQLGDDYRLPRHAARYHEIKTDIATMPAGANYLDVGCGHGDSLDMAIAQGCEVMGTELVDAMVAKRDDVIFADICDLPFTNGQFEYVSCYDVLEHLVPGDEQDALDELGRVCRVRLTMTTNKKPSFLPTGEDLHVNKREQHEWHDDIVARFGADAVHFSRFGADEWKWVVTF